MHGIRIAVAALTASLSTTALAAPAPSEWRPNSITLDSRPPAASAAGKPSCRTPAEYMRRVQTGDTARMADLFTEDAAIILYTGTILRGRETLMGLFGRLVGKPTDAVAFSYTGEKRRCILEMAGRHDPANPTGPYTLSVDVFTLDRANKIKQLIIYIVPPPAVAH